MIQVLIMKGMIFMENNNVQQEETSLPFILPIISVMGAMCAGMLDRVKSVDSVAEFLQKNKE